MKLTQEELDFIKKYRRLNDYEQGTVHGMIDYMAKENDKRGWKLQKGGPNDDKKTD